MFIQVRILRRSVEVEYQSTIQLGNMSLPSREDNLICGHGELQVAAENMRVDAYGVRDVYKQA